MSNHSILQPVSAGKGSELLAIEIGARYVKIAYGKNAAAAFRITGLKYKSFISENPSDYSTFIAQACKELNIKTKSVLLVMPGASYIPKNIDIPSKDPLEIRKIVDLQSGRYTPFSRDEIIVDCLTMEVSNQHYTNVLLTIVNRIEVKRCFDIVEKAGLSVDSVRISGEGLAALMQVSAGTSLLNDPVCGIHIDNDSTDFVVTMANKLIFSRSFPVGVRDLKENRDTAGARLVEEVGVSLDAYEKQGLSSSPQLLYVFGIHSEIDAVEQLIISKVPQVTSKNIAVKTLVYKSNLNVTDKADNVFESALDLSLYSVAANLSAHGWHHLDLTPKDVQIRRKVQAGGRQMILSGVLIMTALLMFSFFLGMKIFLKTQHLKKLELINNSTYEEARILERASTKARLVRNLLEHRGEGLAAYEMISSMIGEDMYLTSFQYDKLGDIKFSGTVDSMSKVFAFVTELDESNFFTEVKTTQTKTRKEGAREVADFEIKCRLTEGVS